MRRPQDLRGKRFGKLLVLYPGAVQYKGNPARRHFAWVTLCDCGNKREVVTTRLTKGITTDCGECGVSVNRYNYQRIRSHFTEAEWFRYHDILRGRDSQEDQLDAVELVVLERGLGEGVCCAKCQGAVSDSEFDRRRFGQYENREAA